ncbi:MAG: hypothetical protein JSW61_12495 [Candidatus Thorarchaeota archaeon]|nr:MAG: hypothetical protein JSW61_12495 [Candidatus Thorarchaeota archaeon]
MGRDELCPTLSFRRLMRASDAVAVTPEIIRPHCRFFEYQAMLYTFILGKTQTAVNSKRWGVVVSETGVQDGHPSPIELDIIRSFGWSVIEFEATLYHKFLHLSAGRSLIAEEDFRRILREMEAKGFVASTELHGKRALRRLLIEEELEESLKPQVPLDEIRLALGQLEAKKKEASDGPPRVSGNLVTGARVIGKDLLESLEESLLQGKPADDSDRVTVQSHIGNMRRALCDSEEALLEYVEIHVPGLLHHVKQLLKARGSEFILLSLRLVEAN